MSDRVTDKFNVKKIFYTMEYGPVSEGKNLAESWISQHADHLGPFINGRFCPATEGTQFFRSGIKAILKLNDKQDSAAAIDAAVRASTSWMQMDCHDRAKVLYSVARHMQKHITLLTQVEALSRGVQVRDAREIDVPAIIRIFYYYAGWAQLSKTEFTTFQPYGVVAGVTSASSPLLSLALIVAPALAAGNSVILLPDPLNSLSALLLADICTSANVPPGVLNVVPREHADPAQCTILVSEEVKKVTGFGPVSLGCDLSSLSASKQLHNHALLLGGCVPMIVLESADLDAAVDCVIDAAWSNQGQDPWSLRLLVVQEAVLESMKKQLTARISGLQLGGAFDKMADVGNILMDSGIAERLQKVLLLDPSAEVVRPCSAKPGEWVPTAIYASSPLSTPVLAEENVCPVVHVVGARSAKEAVGIANHYGGGLAASVWTESNALAWEVASQLKAGTVWVNSHGLMDAAVSMTGRNRSGCGSFGGRDGVIEYLKPTEHSSKLGTKTQSVLKTSILPTGAGTDSLIDQTYKLFYGGGHKRPDSNSNRTLLDKNNKPFAMIPEASRKDVRNAVEAAVKVQPGWWKRDPHNRAQILFNLAEKLEGRRNHFIRHLLIVYDHNNERDCAEEVDESISVLFHWAAVCDKFLQPSGSTFISGMAVTVAREPLGVVGVIFRQGSGKALLDVVTLIGAALAYGNVCIIAAQPDYPTPALELAQIMEAAEIPAGVVNVLCGETTGLLTTLAEHMEVCALWLIGPQDENCQKDAKSNMKRIWVQDSVASPVDAAYRHIYEVQASHGKNIWMPTTASFGT